ncbi:MAG: hypothetical protein ACRDVM_00255 [Acidimicrobiia bacterium]
MPITRPHLGQPVTLEEWEALGETEERYEVVHGRAQVSPGANVLHARSRALIASLLGYRTVDGGSRV